MVKVMPRGYKLAIPIVEVSRYQKLPLVKSVTIEGEVIISLVLRRVHESDNATTLTLVRATAQHFPNLHYLRTSIESEPGNGMLMVTNVGQELLIFREKGHYQLHCFPELDGHEAQEVVDIETEGLTWDKGLSPCFRGVSNGTLMSVEPDRTGRETTQQNFFFCL